VSKFAKIALLNEWCYNRQHRTGEQRGVYIGPRHTDAVRWLGPVGSYLYSIWECVNCQPV